MARLDKIGAFGLTEPDVGSGAAGGLTTTARREGDHWRLNGQKKWIGNATFADLTVIWARDEATNQVKGFVVEKGAPGFSAEEIENKIALRVVQNALITLADCRVAEADRLQNGECFKDTAQVLKLTRACVAWFAVGCQLGAFEHVATLREASQTVRPTHRRIPAGSGSPCPDARKHYRDPVDDAPPLPVAGSGTLERRTCVARQSLLHGQDA